MTDRQTMVTLRIRVLAPGVVTGALIAAPKGKTVYRILGVTRVHTAGDAASHRFRLAVASLDPGQVPEGATVLPWPAAPAPHRGRPAASPGSPSVRVAGAVAKVRVSAELAQLARAARVGRDEGMQDGRDFGPGIRLRPIRLRRTSGLLREADVVIEHAADSDRPARTVRRARRSDPLLHPRLALPGPAIDAAERLRDDLEGSEMPARSCLGGSDVRAAPHRRSGINIRMLEARTAVRLAMSSLTPIHRASVLWIVLGGTIDACAVFARTPKSTITERLRAGLGELAVHYFGNVGDRRPSRIRAVALA